MLHRDLKSANVLLFRAGGGDGPLDAGSLLNCTAKLCDFGLATGLNPAVTMLQSTRSDNAAGTLAYTAPEAFDDHYDEQAEVYAYGILLWEILTCEVPWSVNQSTGKPFTPAALIKTVLAGKRPELPKALDSPAIELLGPLAERCWQETAVARPSFEQIARQVTLGLQQTARTHRPDVPTTPGGWPSPPIGYTAPSAMPNPAALPRPRHVNKLTRTLRQSSPLHRSHKAEYNEVNKTRAGRQTSGRNSGGEREVPNPNLKVGVPGDVVQRI